MKTLFEPSFFKANRKRLLKSVNAKLLVLPANTALQRNGDTTYPFRQDSNFWYLTGINEPDYVLVLSDAETYLIAPELTSYQLVMEAQTGKDTLKKESAIDNIYGSEEGWDKLKKQLRKTRRVGILPAPKTSYYGFTANPARSKLIRQLKKLAPNHNYIDIRKEFTHLRMIKQPQELEAIQAAIDITSQTIKDVFKGKWYKKYVHEFEVEAALSGGFRANGASGHAFTPIVISGHKTSSIHDFNSEDKLVRDTTIQVDVGAEVANYAADISRVFPIGDEFTPRQKEIVAAVKDVQKYAMSIIKPGTLIKENEKLIEQYMGKTLKDLGLISAQTTKAIRTRYPHNCSHMVGLDVHDAADYDIPLAENMVITVEPGIYIPEEGLGVRIEDDVLITKKGLKVLTENLPQRLS